MLPLRFAPDHSLAGTPNVVVDGSPNADTVLTLSHWPGMPTPPELRDDLSAQIAFRALDEPWRFEGVDVVTNNHFDQDGVAGIFALTHPDTARRHRDLLIDIARAGDFGTFHDRTAARLAMAIAALDQDDRSPLPREQLDLPYPQRCAALYEWALPRLGDVLDAPDRWSDLWRDEDAHLDESLRAIADGTVTVTEFPDIDLAVVTVPDQWSDRAAHRFTQRWTEALHPMAVNNSTGCVRVALVQGGRYRLELRYETWVMLTSRHVLARPHLEPLADELTALETRGATWRADAVGALTPKLSLADDATSSLAPDTFIATVDRYLRAAPPAWNPFAPEG